ncbi:MAG: RNA polymerase factor sigma-54 [Alphaproteobacteria bacterium]
MSNIYKQNIEARITQSLCMTQELQQSIKLLQLSSIELNQFITAQLETNPLLETLEVDSENISENIKKEDNDYITPEIYENTWSNSEKNNRNDFINSNLSHLENFSNNSKSLKEQVSEQINLIITNDLKRNIAEHLCDLLDENGYIREDLSDIALQLNCNIQEITDTLIELQKLEPIGIFARNLTECLTIQLKYQNCYNEDYARVLLNLDLLTNSNKKIILKKCELDEDQLKEILNKIKTLNPKPGSNYTNEKSKFIIPDVYIVKDKTGKYIAKINNRITQSVYVNNQYYNDVRPKIKNTEDQKYLSHNFTTANWLLKALKQRADTLLKVSNVIAEKQQKFFDYGIKYLTPLKLKDIAVELDIHESTVSRVTSNKYINTPRGNFDMKYFFSTSLSPSAEQQNSSSTSVKSLIKDIISAENENILSDDEISKMLKNLNIDIARRTVAKYRESLNIPTSSLRKREKHLLNNL